LRQNL